MAHYNRICRPEEDKKTFQIQSQWIAFTLERLVQVVTMLLPSNFDIKNLGSADWGKRYKYWWLTRRWSTLHLRQWPNNLQYHQCLIIQKCGKYVARSCGFAWAELSLKVAVSYTAAAVWCRFWSKPIKSMFEYRVPEPVLGVLYLVTICSQFKIYCNLKKTLPHHNFVFVPNAWMDLSKWGQPMLHFAKTSILKLPHFELLDSRKGKLDQYFIYLYNCFAFRSVHKIN